MASKLPLQNIDNANVAKAPASSLASAGKTIEHILLCSEETIEKNLEDGLMKLNKKLKLMLKIKAAFAGATDGAEESEELDYATLDYATQKVNKLSAQRDQMEKALQEYLITKPESLWLKDLEEERQAPKKPAPKKASESVTKEASNSAMDTETTGTSKEISLDDDDDDVSPEKKVRKLRSSPFNKKSSSVMANKEEESSENAAGNSSSEKSGDVFANRGYVWWSDSESESGNESEVDDDMSLKTLKMICRVTGREMRLV